MAAKTKAAARCTECDSAFAVWQSSEGRIVPIGSVDGCSCGGTEFELLSRSSPAGGR